MPCVRGAIAMTIDLAALRAALDAATKGEWFIAGVGRIACQTHGVIVECALYYRAGEADQEANTAYIVAVQPRVVRGLIAEVERLREAASLLLEQKRAGETTVIAWQMLAEALAGDRHD